MRSLSRALPITNLPSIPYTLPKQQTFQAESSGAFRKEWIRGLPAYRKMAENARYLPSHEDFWKASPSQAVSIIASRMNYHDMLHSAALDGILPIEALLRSPGAPTPDIIYEDIMRWKTFDRIQKPPEEQFVLEKNILQQLLAHSAHLVMVDPEYFARAELFFRKIEQQQNIGSAAYSCWALMCVASARISMALDVIVFMDAQGMVFDQNVFVLCMNPGASDFQSRIRGGDKSSKGFVRQLRLLNRLAVSVDTNRMASTAAIHAFFVMFNLTLNHISKWELLRRVVGDMRFIVSTRTMQYAAAMLEAEGARRCGSLTVQALLVLFARSGDFTACFTLLSRVRQNEAIEAHLQMCPVVVVRKETIQVVEKCMEAHKKPSESSADRWNEKSPSDNIEPTRSFSDVIESVRALEKDTSMDLPQILRESHADAQKDTTLACRWVSFLMRIRENGICGMALASILRAVWKDEKTAETLSKSLRGISGEGNVHGPTLLSPSSEPKRSVKRRGEKSTRQRFLHVVLDVQPLKPLRVPLRKQSTRQLRAKNKDNTVRKEKVLEKQPSPPILDINLPETTKKSTSESSPPTSATQSAVSHENAAPDAQPIPSTSPRPPKTRTPSERPNKNYVEEIPATNNPFEQDEEQNALMRRVQKRQETQTDIDTSQNKQAMDQLHQREKERRERVGRLPQAWTLS